MSRPTEVVSSMNGTLEDPVSSTSTGALNIPLESSREVKLLPSLSPDLLQKSSNEPTLKHFNKVTDASSGILDFSNSAKVDHTPVLNKQQPQNKGEHGHVECVQGGDKVQNEAVNLIHYNSGVLTADTKTEESFTEVKKKKKRAGPSNVSTFHSAAANSPKGFFTGSFHHQNSRFRHNASQVNSNSVSTMHSLVVGNHAHSPRDLSPSSFPALTGTPPRMDVRRNSCDGINTVSLDTKNDSDRESVQSLPVTHCARAVGELSPQYMVSYATMVAAPPKGDNVNSSESSVISASVSSAHTSSSSQLYGAACGTPEKKTTVWKGSPRERRHSIGSSPEDKAEVDKPNIAQRHRQKSGSQELLFRESSAALKSSTVNSAQIINNLQLHIKQENNASEVKPSVTVCLESEFQNLNSQIVHVSSDSLPPFSLETPLSESVSKISPTCEGGSHIDNRPHKETSLLEEKTSENASVVVVDSKSHKSNTSTSIPEVTRKSNTNNHKSVVFLDRRYGTAPYKNLGITFGFDSDIESAPDSASQVVPTPSTNVKTSKSKPAGPSTPVDSHIPPDSGAPLASDFRVSSCYDNSQDLKAGLVQNRCNGLVHPTGNRNDQSLGKTVCDNNRTKSCDAKEASLSQPLAVKSNLSESKETSSSNVSPSCKNPNSIGSGGVIFSPNHPPPPYSLGASTAPTSNSCLNSLSSTDQSATCQKVSALQEMNLAAEIINSSIPVIYGLKIHPNKGCGKVMFIPPNVQLGVSSAAVCAFLKKQWFQVKNKEKANPGLFKTCDEDEENSVKS